jgi:arylsulfatase A-like enzyme
MIKSASLLLLTLAGICFAAESKPLSGSRPNIILILTDDQGMGDLSCTGNPYLKTPHLDRLHAKSTRFTDFQVSPTCSPTRAAIMSGRHEFEVGVTHTILQRERLAPGVVTVAEALRRAGYATGLFGKWHLGDEASYLPQQRGFDEVLMHGAGGIGQSGFGDFQENAQNPYFDNVLLHNDTIVRTKGFCTDLFFAAAMAWINRQHEAKKPFFAYIPLNAPHSPMIAPEKSKKRFLNLGFDEKSAARYGMIENIDHNVGLLLDDLEAHGMLEETLVVFMTDNGMSMGSGSIHGKKFTPFNAGLKGGKCSPEEGGTRVPRSGCGRDIWRRDSTFLRSPRTLTSIELSAHSLEPRFPRVRSNLGGAR